MNRSNEMEPLFAQPVTVPPASVDVAAIRRRVARKRSIRRATTGGLLATVMIGLMAAPFIADAWKARVDQPNPGLANSQSATEPSAVSSVPIDPIAEQDLVQAKSAGDRESVTTTGDEKENPVEELRLFAQVRGQVPVFELEEKTQRFYHVGWMESEKTIPVDVNRLSRRQQAEARAALYRETVNVPLSL